MPQSVPPAFHQSLGCTGASSVQMTPSDVAVVKQTGDGYSCCCGTKHPFGVFTTFNLFKLTPTESTCGLNQVDWTNKLFSNMHSLQMAYACLHVREARWSINSLFVFHTGVLYGLYVPHRCQNCQEVTSND